MDFPQYSYYKLNKILLYVIGQGPYQKRRSRYIRRIIINSILLSSVIAQISSLVVGNFSLELTFEVVPALVFIFSIFLYSIIFYINTAKFEDLWKRMKEDWNSERIEEETKIKEKYAATGKLITIILIWILIGLIVVFVPLASLATQILDIILPLNESRPRQHIFKSEYFLDQEQYFYSILIYIELVIVTGAIFTVANQSMFCVLMQHICGMFAVLGYRLENAVLKNIDRNPKDRCDSINKMYYHSIVLCVNRHQKAAEFLTTMESCYGPILFASLLMAILIITPALIQVSDINSIRLTAVCEIILIVGYIFANSYMGQQLINLSSELAERAYFSQWMNCSIKIQKMMPLIIRRCKNPCGISAYGFFFLTLDCFRMVMQTGLTYCMVLKQMQ